ncbi:MAG TPA: response regulator transcription factor [archaeon]|nr:response regulator transcription factor [archaeon]
MSSTILIADDNADVRFFVRASLESAGYKVVEAVDGRSALKKFDETRPELTILDLSMGQPDGLEVCSQIRRISNIPIIMLTSRDQEVDEAMCLVAGADDYITKPVTERILVLRVSAQLRRASAGHSRSVTTLEFGPIKLDQDSREVHVDSVGVSLTPTEFDLLRLLISNPRRVFTRGQIMIAIGMNADFGGNSALDTQVSRLRSKIRDAGASDFLHGIRGVGYRLSPPG